ncbi:MAG: SsrA-binding protein SmpB [Acidobacteriota bacterium]
MAGSKAGRKPQKVGDKIILARNRRALHDYEVLETFEAGMVLAGTEVKAARDGKVQLKDAYVDVRNGEAWLVGAHISPYSHGNRQNHPADRDRKLLLSRRELDRIYGRTQLKGQTAIPLSVYLRGNWLKLEVALAQGKKHYDKRETVKKRILDREAEAAIKGGSAHR